MSMYAIASYTVTSPVTPITFTSIPQTFTHLQIRAYAQSSSGNAAIRFNGDAGNNYAYHYINGSGAALTSAGTATTGNGYLSLFMGSTSSNFGGVIADIFDYTNTNKNKTMKVIGGADLNGSGNVFFSSTLWQSTSAITSLSLIPDTSGTFSIGTRIDLYGIATSNATGA